MTDIAARLDAIERAITNLPEWSEALADIDRLVAALRAVLDPDTLRNLIEAVIEDNTDERGCLLDIDIWHYKIANRITALAAAALVSA